MNADFVLLEQQLLSMPGEVSLQSLNYEGQSLPVLRGEFWTSRQRQAHSLHEVSYRACFKPQLPRFFIERFTQAGDLVYDPFSGRGTTALEAALMGRRVAANDINPLSKLLCEPRLHPPAVLAIQERLQRIDWQGSNEHAPDLHMFYHPDTLRELLSLRSYFFQKQKNHTYDHIDAWIRMVATNRLTGHSKGFFSVYTLPPNQAVSRERQIKINEKRKQLPEYRPVAELILRKSKQLLKGIRPEEHARLTDFADAALFITGDARHTPQIAHESVQLTVTSPPFLDVVQYAADNWLRCWFNGIDAEEVGKNITMSRKVEDWQKVMQAVFQELYRITRGGGVVAFEVGEVRGGKIRLEEYVLQLGLNVGFRCEGIMLNEQVFTKTANIWGVANNAKGTNSNRIVVFSKPG